MSGKKRQPFTLDLDGLDARIVPATEVPDIEAADGEFVAASMDDLVWASIAGTSRPPARPYPIPVRAPDGRIVAAATTRIGKSTPETTEVVFDMRPIREEDRAVWREAGEVQGVTLPADRAAAVVAFLTDPPDVFHVTIGPAGVVEDD